jgi:hypothetical protein
LITLWIKALTGFCYCLENNGFEVIVAFGWSMDFSEKNAEKWRTDTVAAAVTVPI